MNDSNRRRVLAVFCMFSLTVLYCVTSIHALVSEGESLTRTAIAVRGFVAVLHVGLIVGAAFGIAQIVRGRADRLGMLGASITLLGATVAARIGVLSQLSLVRTNGVDTGLVAHELSRDVPLVWVSVVPIGLLYPTGLILLGAALISARPVSRWIGVLVVIAGVLFPIGRAIGVPPAIYGSDLILAAALAMLGWQLLQRREVWAGEPAASV